jgi:hypothetical protein
MRPRLSLHARAQLLNRFRTAAGNAEVDLLYVRLCAAVLRIQRWEPAWQLWLTLEWRDRLQRRVLDRQDAAWYLTWFHEADDLADRLLQGQDRFGRSR